LIKVAGRNDGVDQLSTLWAFFKIDRLALQQQLHRSCGGTMRGTRWCRPRPENIRP